MIHLMKKKITLLKKTLIDESTSIEDKLFKSSESFSKYTYSISKLMKNNV